MKKLINRMWFLGLVLLITPFLSVASNGYLGKPTAFKAMLISLCGLALAAAGAWCHHLLRRLDRLKEERNSRLPQIICFDVSPDPSPHILPPSSF
jgi:hypothetical protein